MTTLTFDADGTPRQDGQTPDEWLRELFEFEICPECGFDHDKHTVGPSPLGHFFAYCNDPIDDTLSPEEFDAEFELRIDSYSSKTA